LSSQEKLAAEELKASFGIKHTEHVEERVELELKKGYYYVLDEDNTLID